MNDNGTAGGQGIWNAGMRGAKGTAWRGGTRAASLWRWPGTVMPHAVTLPCADLDYFATLSELAEVKLEDSEAKQNEGRSLVPLLKDAP